MLGKQGQVLFKVFKLEFVKICGEHTVKEQRTELPGHKNGFCSVQPIRSASARNEGNSFLDKCRYEQDLFTWTLV